MGKAFLAPNNVVIWNEQAMDYLDLQIMMQFLYVAVIQKIKKKTEVHFDTAW